MSQWCAADGDGAGECTRLHCFAAPTQRSAPSPSPVRRRMTMLESAFATETRFSSAQPRTSAGVHSAALSHFHIKPTCSTCAASAPRTQRLRVYSHAEHAELCVGDGGVEGAGERGNHLLRLRQRYFKTATRLRTCAKINNRGRRLQTPRATHRFCPPGPATLAGACGGNGIAHGCSAASTMPLNVGHE